MHLGAPGRERGLSERSQRPQTGRLESRASGLPGRRSFSVARRTVVANNVAAAVYDLKFDHDGLWPDDQPVWEHLRVLKRVHVP
jgi:hypothetical protein